MGFNDYSSYRDCWIFYSENTIGRKIPLYVNWLNIIGVAFMPISMITGYISGLVFKLEGWIAPYPIGIFHTLVFVLVFFVVVIASYIILKKQTK